MSLQTVCLWSCTCETSPKGGLHGPVLLWMLQLRGSFGGERTFRRAVGANRDGPRFQSIYDVCLRGWVLLAFEWIVLFGNAPKVFAYKAAAARYVEQRRECTCMTLYALVWVLLLSESWTDWELSEHRGRSATRTVLSCMWKTLKDSAVIRVWRCHMLKHVKTRRFSSTCLWMQKVSTRLWAQTPATPEGKLSPLAPKLASVAK